MTAGATEITVRPLAGWRDWKLFEHLPELLHGGHPAFIPSIPGTVTVLRKDTHPFHLHGEIFPFLAFRGGQPVGRVAAIVNRTHNQHHQDQVGFVGFFDCIDNKEVAQALFRTAEKELSGRGLGPLRGPFSPTQNDPCGVLVDGFEYPPMFLMPWNPPYYTGLWEAAGWRGVRDLYGYRVPISYDFVGDRRRRLVERFRKRSGITVRPGSRRHFQRDLDIIRSLFNETLDGEWNFMPLSREDFEYAAKELRWILDPGLIGIAEHDGRPVGFSLTLPDINEAMAKAAQWRGPLRFLRFAWEAMTRRPAGIRLVALGILPEYQPTGLSSLFYHDLLTYGNGRYSAIEVSWVQDVNTDTNRRLLDFEADLYKTYRVFEKTLPGG